MWIVEDVHKSSWRWLYIVFVGGGEDYPKSSLVVVEEHVRLIADMLSGILIENPPRRKRIARRRREQGDRWNGHQLIAQLVVVAHGERGRNVVGINTTNNSKSK